MDRIEHVKGTYRNIYYSNVHNGKILKMLWILSTRKIVNGPEGSLRSLSKIQNLGPHHRPTESEPTLQQDHQMIYMHVKFEKHLFK